MHISINKTCGGGSPLFASAIRRPYELLPVETQSRHLQDKRVSVESAAVAATSATTKQPQQHRRKMVVSSPNDAKTRRSNDNRGNVSNRAWSSVILAVIIFLNSLVYFVCQTIASNCLAQVIAKFPFQIESFIPFKLRTTTEESAEKQSQAFTQSTTTSVEATTGG